MANLSALLEREAGAEIESILSEARERASEIKSRAEEEAESIRAQRERAASTQSEAIRVRGRSSAQLEASSMRLRAQHRAVESVFDQAERDLRDLTKDNKRYKPILTSLLDEVVESLGGSDKISKLFVNPNDKKHLSDAAKKHGLGDKLETDESVQGGVKVRSTEASVTVENSLFDRLEAAKDDLASVVSKALFSEGGAQGSSGSSNAEAASNEDDSGSSDAATDSEEAGATDSSADEAADKTGGASTSGSDDETPDEDD